MGWQASPKIFAWASTLLAHIKLSNTANAFFIADFIPLELGLYDRLSKDIDLGGFVAITNLENSSTDFEVALALRYYHHGGM